MNNGYFPSYFGHHGLGAPPPPVLDPALSSWSTNPHLAAAMAAAAAAEHMRANPAMAAAAAAFPHHPYYAGLGGHPGHPGHHPHHPSSAPPSRFLPPPPPTAPLVPPHQPLQPPEDKSDKRSIISNISSSVGGGGGGGGIGSNVGGVVGHGKLPPSSSSTSSWSSVASTVAASAAAGDQIQNTTSSHMFNTGLPPLDRHGLFPSNGSILDPLQTPSFSSQPKKPEPSFARARTPPKAPVTVNLASSESDEEVLVDDFDGQCCRTYPDNHSRIIKWRALRAEKAKQLSNVAANKTSSASSAAPALTTTTSTSSSSSSNSSASATASSSSSVIKSLSSRKAHEAGKSKDGGPTSSGSGIPVGIAIGRQRQPGTSVPPSWPLTSPTGCGPVSAPPHVPQGPPGGPPTGLPGPHPSGLHSPWMPPHLPSPAGPIPMGYQLAKDPLTGQILLIPTDPSQPPGPSSWPHMASGRYEYGMDRIPPGVLQSHYHQLYLQQQHMRYYHHGLTSDPLRMNLRPPLPSSNNDSLMTPKASNKIEPRKEPETITVSDDDDEEPESVAKVQSEAENSVPMDLVGRPKKAAEEEKASDLSLGDVERVKIKQEPPEEEVERGVPEADLKFVAESLLDLSTWVELAEETKGIPDVKSENEEIFGFEALIRGIELHEKAHNGIDMLCAVTEEDGHHVPYFSSHMILSSRLDVLCCVTKGDKSDFDHYVDPLVLIKQHYNLHEYHRGQHSAEAIQNFIQNKSAYFKKLNETPEGSFMDETEPPSLAKILKKIKNTDFGSDLEVELRRKLFALQDEYREKQSQLTRLKSPRKRVLNKKKGKVAKRTITPKKLVVAKRRASHSPALTNNPPRLEPTSPPRLQSTSAQAWKQSSAAMLKPPKLTASFSPAAQKRSVTDLSTIKAKFMKGKSSPFANLMKLATNESRPGSSTGGPNSPVKAMPDIDEEIEHSEDSEDDFESNSDEDEFAAFGEKKAVPGKRGRSSSLEDSSSSKKRKADKPKKQSGTTETIVPKKPKNLFMMNCYEFDGSYPSKDEEEEDEEDEEDEEEEEETKEDDKPIHQPEPLPSLPSTSSLDSVGKLRDARLCENDLSDGMKLLILQEGRFWPAWLHSTQLPDVYGIVMEKQRGNRPQILPRDDILREAIYEVKPENKSQLPLGTRVCVYWSRAYNCLFPGTIEELDDVVLDKNNMVQVLLDDGDRRQVDVASVRMLPQNYSHVDYDPDPIATLRKRRISADSVDSTGHGARETMHSLMAGHAPLMTSPLAKSSEGPSGSSPLKKKADKHRHKKKRKHHHCKRKHKRQHRSSTNEDEEDDSLKIKLDGSFNNTTTYSIRSPMYHHKSEDSNHEDEDDYDEEDSSEDSESDNENKRNNTNSKRSGINPVTGRPLWHWADEGYRRPGSKGKAKKLFHRSIARGTDEILNVGDCAVFLSTARVDRPYIGQVELLWETWNGNMMVKVKWFYHPEEIETTGGTVDLRVPGGLFQSPHTDENDVQTISHKCAVLPLKEYSRLMISDPAKRKKIYSSSDTYYLAGSYDPTAMTVNFQPGVLRH